MEDLIIIGSGPAGLTAAIYTGRAGLAPVVFEGSQPGGQLTTTTEVENFPGFHQGVQGPQMMQLFKEQAARFGTKILGKTVKSVDFSKPPFKVVTDDGTFAAPAIIIATGATAARLGLENEKKLYGKGVSACATCDGPFFREKTVVVVGGGDTALEEATYLTRFAKKVYLIHRRDSLRASKAMQDKALTNGKIEFVWNTVVEDILGVEAGHVIGVKLKNLQTGQFTELPCEGVFAAIGHEPNTKVFAGQVELDVKGYIVTAPGSTKTSREGIFAAGDCADHIYRQAVVAAGSGCMAALEAQKYLESVSK